MIKKNVANESKSYLRQTKEVRHCVKYKSQSSREKKRHKHFVIMETLTVTVDKEFGSAMGALFHQIITDMKVNNIYLFKKLFFSCVVDISIVKECNGGKKSTHKVLWKKEKWWPALCRGSLGTWSSFSLYVLFSVCVCVYIQRRRHHGGSGWGVGSKLPVRQMF